MSVSAPSSPVGILQRRRALLAVAVCLAVAIAGGIVVLTHTHSPPPAPKTISRPVPLRVASITPVAAASSVGFTSPITIHFSAPLGTSWKTPALTPATPGSWHRVGRSSLQFRPSGNYVPGEPVRVTIPAGKGGVGSADGTFLAASFTSSFTVTGGSVLRLQQLLAELDYLPVAFVPAAVPIAASPPTGASTSGSSGVPTTTTSAVTPTTTSNEPTSTAALDAEPTVAADIPLQPLDGSFAWRFANIPPQLSSLWSPGAFDVVTQGAVMAFEYEHGLAPDGEAGPAVWTALLQAVAARGVTTRPYDYVLVTETLPESLYVWSEGRVIYSTLANTGVSGATTPLGTWPVYLRYTSTTMTGTNPDGTHYSDPDIPWVSYFHGNDAVHGFVRASYGFPQSDGCVEIPIANAASVFPLDPYGTLVTVTTGDLAAQLSVPIPPPVYVSIPTTTTTTVPSTTSSSTTTSTTRAG